MTESHAAPRPLWAPAAVRVAPVAALIVAPGAVVVAAGLAVAVIGYQRLGRSDVEGRWPAIG